MKAFVFTMLLFILGDFAINHGDGTHYVLGALGAFWHWLASAGSDSIFTR